MNKRIVVLFSAMLFLTSFSPATLIRVPSAQPTIQAGIDAAANGDTVVVYPGTYFENVIFRGKKIVLTSRYYETGDLDFVLSTIIDGSRPKRADTSSCVLIINQEDSTTILQGFTITGGKGTVWRDEHGAGIYREGGGILTALSSPTIRFNLVVNNEATNTSGVVSAGGGGIRAGDGNPRILNNVITQNKARYGAGVVLNWTGAIVKNNIISANSGGQDYGGGALWMNHDGPAEKVIENNTIAANMVIAVYVWQGGSVMRNNIVVAEPIVSAVQIGVRSGGPTVTYCNVWGGWAGIGNFHGDPQFSDSAFHLSNTSPCVDAGDSAAIFRDLESLSSPGTARWPSCGGLRNDIGAYGGPGATALLMPRPVTHIGPAQGFHPAEIRLEQNYPNPFNPKTVVSYELSVVSWVKLVVYDMLGSGVAVLVNERKAPGSYKVTFDASGLPSGAYVCRMEAGSFRESKKVLLLR